MRDSEKARTLTDLLAERHAKDVFVPQCKTGPTNYMPEGGGVQVLDAWAMRKSWAHPTTYGYEIKVSRGDFLQDTKWRGCLPYCSAFYFVCPPGLINLSELPEDVGLLVASTNLKRLYCKRKAVEREVAIPEEIFRYVLMWRAEVGAERNGHGGGLEFWQSWLRQKEDARKTGRTVELEIRRLGGERIRDIEAENSRLRRQNERLADVQRVLVELGIDPSSWNARAELDRRMAEIRGAIPERLTRDIDGALSALQKVRETLGAAGNKEPTS